MKATNGYGSVVCLDKTGKKRRKPYIDKQTPLETKKSPATIEVTGFINTLLFLDMKFNYAYISTFQAVIVIYLKPTLITQSKLLYQRFHLQKAYSWTEIA